MMKPTSPADSESRATDFGVNTPDLLAVVRRAGRHQQDLVARLQRSLHHAHQHDDADVIVEPGIDDERLQRRVRIARRRRDSGDHRLEDVVDAFARLRAREKGIVRGDADNVLDLLDHAVGLRRGKIDLVQHGDDGHALLDRRVAVRHRLRFHTLRRVDDQQRAFARRERARHLVREVDVPRRVDQVEVVALAVARLVRQRRGLRLDRDSALALEIHRVEDLLAHLARREAAAALDEAVCQRRLAMVDVGDDRKVADELHVSRRRSGKPKQRGTGIVPLLARIMLNFSGFSPRARPRTGARDRRATPPRPARVEPVVAYLLAGGGVAGEEHRAPDRHRRARARGWRRRRPTTIVTPSASGERASPPRASRRRDGK
jgi:hypothetical protein